MALTRDNVASLAVKWRTPIDGFITEPVVSDRIYVATRKSVIGDPNELTVLAVQAYDRDTGALVWERSLLPSGGPTLSGHIETPAHAGGALWVPYWHSGLGPCSGRLARLDPATGAVLSEDVTGTSLSGVVVASDLVAYSEGCGAGTTGRVVVRDLASREVRWSHHFATPGVSRPLIDADRLLVFNRDTLHGFAANGCGAPTCSPQWSEPGVGGLSGFLGFASGPAGVATIGSRAIVLRDPSTGVTRWQTEARYTGSFPGQLTGVAMAYDTIYVAGTQTDPTTEQPEAILDAYPAGGCGQPVCPPSWTVNFGPTRPTRQPTVAGGVVYVPLAPDATFPGVAAVDALGCGSPTCPVLARVPFETGPGVPNLTAEPYAVSVARGRVVAGYLPPNVPGAPATELISLGAAES